MASGAFDLPPAQWRELRRLLDEALALTPAARETWLDALGAEQAALRPHLRRLLANADDPRLDTLPKIETGDFADALAQPADASGTLVGPYRLLRPIGEGGMASVWLAERTDVLQKRPVAVKLPHGAWRRAGLAERFAREREILATLDHPNIARVYDAGVAADGQPWLALEYVDGRRIDRYCIEERLGTAARVRLMLQVMDAVAYAHARLVVHRDLKPANVLVNAEGQVRLLDFGIARLLDDGSAGPSALTVDAGRPMTPDYAAPEQVRGEPVGTAVDVHALGVVLFELLTGQRPFAAARASRAALEEAILHTEAPPPSGVVADPGLSRALRGDLDTIVAKALRKEPAQRYATVDAFAADLRRHLAHEPLQARPEPTWARVRKFLRRHRLGALAAGAVLLAVAGGSGAALWQAHEARLQRDAARAAERIAEAQADLSSFLLSDFAEAHADDEMLAQLDHALVMVRAQYRDDAALRGRLLFGIGEQFRWISEHARADAVFEEAEPLLESVGDAAALSQLMCIRAATHARDGRPEAARTLLAQALARNPGGSAMELAARAECLLEQALILRYANDPVAAIARIEEAMAIQGRIGRGEREDASEALNALARAQHEAGRFADAVASAKKSIALLQRIGRPRSPGLRNAWGMAGLSLLEGGRPLEAESAQHAGGTLDPTTDAVPPPLRTYYGITLTELGRSAEAVPLLERAVRDSQAQGATGNARMTLLELVDALVALGRLDDAAARLAQATPMFADVRAKGQPQARRYAFATAGLALARGDAAAARGALDEARRVLEGNPGTPPLAWRSLHRAEAELALQRRDPAAARAAAERALALSAAHAIDPQASLHVGQDLLLRARARAAQGEADGARADAAQAERHLASAAGPAHPAAMQAHALAAR